MAIKPVEKLSLVVHQDDVEAALALLQRTSAVHLVDLSQSVGDDDTAGDEDRALQFRNPIESSEILDKLTQIEHCVELLTQYEPPRKGLDSLFTVKISLTAKDLDKIVETYDSEAVLSEVIQIEDEIRRLSAERDEALKKKDSLAPWATIPVRLDDLAAMDDVLFMGCSIEARLADEFLAEPLPRLSEISLCSKTQNATYLVLAYHRSVTDEMRDWLNDREVTEIKLPTTGGRPKEEIDLLVAKATSFEREIAETKDRLRARVDEKPKLMVVRDHIASTISRTQAEKSFLDTERTTVIEGWILRQDSERVKKLLESKLDCHCTLTPPGPDEQPPISLETSNAAEPFQMVTALYGLPDYTEIDPTPSMAFTFSLFFGICVSDCGYGFVLAFVTWWILRRFPVVGATRQVIKVLYWGGIATIFVGPLTGTYFGIDTMNPPDFLKQFPRLLDILQAITLLPANDPVRFLYVALGIGFVHIHAGLVTAIVKKARTGNLVEGLMEKLPWIVLLPSLTMVIFKDKFGLSDDVVSVAKILSWVGGISVVVISPVGVKNPFMRVGLGVYTLYGISGFMGDVLSYSRLMAFGLVTGGIGSVINKLALMLKAGVPIVGILLAILFLVAGHVFNIVINTLGGFVHTSRLHYLEFFGKFYDGNGKLFRPFRREERYSIVRE